ncbi:Nidogen-2 [Channa argus]|uniref:Nidogen-2 n=1 Tax=Channa argus TaxID=215402 RepID=A0A6G1QUG3_CHAAH|nr:Nidogen-2 [Channa argus]
MDRRQILAVCLLSWSCSVCVVTAIQRTDLFPYGILSGDFILAEGDDETSKVLSLPKPFYFYNAMFSQLYVATNGIISAQDLPMEKQYVDDSFPTDFPVVAPFLADIDTSGGRGQIYYRVTETPNILNRVAQEVHRGFPDAKFTPTHAVVATWDNVAAYEEQIRTNGPSNKINTFQVVIGYDETDSYALFLYPEGGLNFFGTRPKESYNVEIELPARVGFSRGEIPYLIFSRTEGPHFSLTSTEQSVKNLYQVGNTGIPGLWLFHIGNRFSFNNIVPASFGGLLATRPTSGHSFTLDTTTPEYPDFEEYTENTYTDNLEEEDYTLTGRVAESQPSPDRPDHSKSLQPANQHDPSSPEDSGQRVSYGSEDAPMTSEPRYHSEPAERQYAPPNHPETIAGGVARQTQEQPPQAPLEVVDVYPSHRNEPRLSPRRHMVSVDEAEVYLNTGVFQDSTENKQTCDKFQQQCSQNAFCSEYATGFCCHCKPGFYGNGRQCLPEGAPQRVSGKVSGTVTVGLTPVELNNIDLHAYIVVGDGRAYTAISEVPEPVGWALMPVAPIGELFGAEFTRHAEVIFYPGNEHLSVIQTGRGLDDHNHLTVDTIVRGTVPFLPPGAEVTMDPFKETYQYYPSVVTSSSVREFSVVSAERGSESFSFQLKQNITYHDCRHNNGVAGLETLQLTMERVFVMYVKEERILRYAITNKISPVGGEFTGTELVNPCYAGNHDCDTSAQCIPLEGQAFQCKCATGYSGDGRNCYVPVAPTQRPESVCERWKVSLIEHYGGRPEPNQYVPQCQPDGQFSPVQCYGETTHCWCVDQNGREVPGTQSHDAVRPACLPSVAPPTVRPLPRPDVTPPTNTDVTLLYAQGQKIGALPLNGTRLDASRSKTLVTLHGSIVVGIAYDCRENQVYWTDLSARTISRASIAPGAEPEILINTNLVSPEGLAVDFKRRRMFWVDSNPDVIESSNLDGSGRRTLFDTDLVNPRAIIVVSSTGTLYWTDWNRDAPKIESSSVDGHNRRVVVSDGIGLPNALTYDSSSGQICWADAGTKRLECVSPDGSGRRVIHSNLNYPFSLVYYRNHFYYTDWRRSAVVTVHPELVSVPNRDGVIAVSKHSSQFTDEYLPDQRSHLYGITIATTNCLSEFNVVKMEPWGLINL